MDETITNHIEAGTIALDLIRNAKAFILIAVPDNADQPHAVASLNLLNGLERRGFEEISLETLTIILAGENYHDDDNEQ